MRLTIHLPRDRSKHGVLYLQNDDGLLLLRAVPCLGKADNARAAKEGNPRRTSTRPYGDTPLGVYAPARIVTHEPPHPRMGRYVLPLEGIAGEALLAAAERTGLAVHGGRGSEKLVPTFGCVRLLDKDMAILVAKVGDHEVTTTIAQADDEFLSAKSGD